jgi:hypothetical protein
MITTVTASAVAAIQANTSFWRSDAAIIFTLLTLIVLREMAMALPGPRAASVSNTLWVAIVPLMLATFLLLTVRFGQISALP